MAVQDFAKTEVPVESPERVQPRYKISLITVLVLIVVLAVFMGGFWLGKQQGIEIAAGEDKGRLEKLLRQQQGEMDLLRAAAKQNKQPEVSTTQVGELTFYNELLNQDVQPTSLHANAVKKVSSVKFKPQTHIPISSKDAMRKMIEEELRQDVGVSHSPVAGTNSDALVRPISAESKVAYMLQLGSFQKQNDAYTFLEKLRKKGNISFIRRVELPERGVWYRVYLGPYDSRNAANAAKDKVKKILEITGLVVKGR
ncbi:MAG: SPOR domain-containing protein [Mariprofundaceae bacterium]|nr:SPOR domain-containing protein [Mariprofundaceae bacterium]